VTEPEKRRMPPRGLPADDVLAAMRDAASDDADWRGGRTFSLVYHAGDDHSALLRDAYAMFMAENGLSPGAFPSLRRFEADVVRWTATMLGGDENAAGTMTSGGTESILMAVKTARDWARAEKPDVAEPEMVLPVTAHPAFDKAAHYLCVKPVKVPVRDDFRADVDAVRAAVGRATVLVVGSAPAYPHGVVDPIAEMAAIAAERGSLFHTDACLGGFLLPWLRRLGHPIPAFGLDVPGVTSVSADVHKYGFAAKGASTVIYRDAALRKHQFFATVDWPGGLYGSPSMTGTRPGGGIAAAWAAMVRLGEEGYLDLARRIAATAQRLKDGVAAVPGLKVLGTPPASVFAFGSDTFDVQVVGDVMADRGWHLDRQQLPSSLHCMVTPAHEPVADAFLADLRAAAEVAAAGPPPDGVSGMAAIYGMLGTVPDRGFAKDIVIDFLGQMLEVERS